MELYHIFDHRQQKQNNEKNVEATSDQYMLQFSVR